MELDHHHQTQPQFKVASESQSAHGTTSTTVLAYHDPAAPCINNVGEPMNEDYHGSNFIDHEAFFNSLPPGIRFRPTKEELVENYLLPKIKGEILPPSHIRDVNLYEDSPDKITERYKSDEEDWYFFTPRDRKYPKGYRPKRAAGDGYWKATGADVKIFDNYRKKIGCKRSLVYFVGKPPNGEKTNWIMHEYVAHQEDKTQEKTTTMRLDDYVLCRIYKKNDQSSKGHPREGFPGGTDPSTSVNDGKYNINARELMNSQEDTLMLDASSTGHDNLSSNFLVKEATTLNYGSSYGLGEEFEDISLGDLDKAKVPLNYGSCYGMEEEYEFISLLDLDKDTLLPNSGSSYGLEEEFEDISLDLDNFLVPIDDHP